MDKNYIYGDEVNSLIKDKQIFIDFINDSRIEEKIIKATENEVIQYIENENISGIISNSSPFIGYTTYVDEGFTYDNFEIMDITLLGDNIVLDLTFDYLKDIELNSIDTIDKQFIDSKVITTCYNIKATLIWTIDKSLKPDEIICEDNLADISIEIISQEVEMEPYDDGLDLLH
ncbi:hypothetical protein J2Z43_002611 [Clostridioides mangenotii]|uniref:Uncharacterized protein n=1 Tax=Metaclostridioides mangenotii TaxID=1540 RepID=A0ABS4EDZ3_9FIRM|nr:hypothetical protein [Clostridioides mangenotii]MBP1856163.1 hypothetical protein [Clostridioides mangenotii]